jgi:predicted transcriptional regulator
MTMGIRQPSSSDRGQPGTKTMADLLFLPDPERGLMNWLLRQRSASLTEVATYLAGDETTSAECNLEGNARSLLEKLAAEGFLQTTESEGQIRYQPCLASRRGRQVPSNIWDALDS